MKVELFCLHHLSIIFTLVLRCLLPIAPRLQHRHPPPSIKAHKYHPQKSYMGDNLWLEWRLEEHDDGIENFSSTWLWCNLLQRAGWVFCCKNHRPLKYFSRKLQWQRGKKPAMRPNLVYDTARLQQKAKGDFVIMIFQYNKSWICTVYLVQSSSMIVMITCSKHFHVLYIPAIRSLYIQFFSNWRFYLWRSNAGNWCGSPSHRHCLYPPTLTLLQVVSLTLTLYPLLHCIHQRTIQSALFHIMLLNCYVLCSCILNNSASTSYLVHTWLHLFFCWTLHLNIVEST